MLDGKRIKLLASRVTDGNGKAGVLTVMNGDLVVYCGKGALVLTEIQTENGKRMSGREYLLGHPLKNGVELE